MRDFIVDWLESEWDNVLHDPEDVMESLGWRKFRVDKRKLDSALNETFTETVDGILDLMRDELRKHGLSDREGEELLSSVITAGPIRDLGRYEYVAHKLHNILSDNTADYLASALMKAKKRR